jgi:DNA-binding transcriptional regulator YiaG
MNDATMAPASLERDMTPEEFRAWYARLGLPESELARRLDVKQPTVNRWRSGERTPPGYLWRALEHLEAELKRERGSKRRRQRGAGGSETE